MTVADHIVVGEVGFAAWKSSDAFRGVDLSADVIERARRAYEVFSGEAKGDVWIADLDGMVAGWAARDGAPNYISDLWVSADHQGQGIGRALLEHACRLIAAEGHATATIHTHAGNTGAIRLYQRCGFVIVWQGIEHSKSLGLDLDKVHLERAVQIGTL